MKTNKRLLARAVTVALMGAAGTASAYLPTSNDDADITVHWGGASASTQTFQESVIDFVCDSTKGSVDVFQPSGTVDNWGVACTSTTTKLGIDTNGTPKRVLVVKRDNGGSGTGVGTLQVNTPVDFLDVSADVAGRNCFNAAPVAKTSNGGTSFNVYACPGTARVTKLVEAGYSDIEPSKFFGINTPVISVSGVNTSFPFLPSVPFDAGTPKPVAGLLFNTPVTLELYKALQRAQFPASHPLHNQCSPDGTQYLQNAAGATVPISDKTANANSEKCLPSLTSQEIRSIMSGNVKTWDELKVQQVDATTGLPVPGSTLPLTNVAYTPAGTITNNGVQICRRVEGSGTQAQFNAIFLNYPCDLNVKQPTKNTFGNPGVVLNSGSGDVEVCLTDFNNGTNLSTAPANDNPTSAKKFAIGVLSLEKGAGLTKNYRFIKIDGVAPTLQNVHKGDYFDFVESSAQFRDTSGALSFNVSGTPAEKRKVFDTLSSNLATPAGLVTINSSLVHSFGQSGWLAIPTASNVPDLDLIFSRPINVYTRAPNNQAPNHCEPPIKTQISGSFGLIISPNPDFNPLNP